MRYPMKHLYHHLFTLLFLLIFFKSSVSAQNFVRLGKVGEWYNNYGDFTAVEVKEINGVTYAFCATSKGMAVYSIHYENIGQNKTKADVLFISFVPIGYCTDIVVEERGGYEKDFYAYITVRDNGLYIRNVTNPAFSYHVATCDTPGDGEGLAIAGDYAFVADGKSGLQVIDISNKEGPVIVGICDIPGYAQGVAIATIESREYVFVADRDSGLQVIDISDPTEPKIEGSCDTPGYAQGVAIATIGSREYVFVADRDSGLQVIDISDPTEPRIEGSCDTPGYAQGVAIATIGSREYVFVADRDSGLQVIDISDPTEPRIKGNCGIPGYAQGVAIATIESREYVFVADRDSGLQVIDISDPTGPSIVGICDTPGTANGIVISGNYVFVADGGSGLLIIDISDPTGPSIVGICDTPGTANGIAISGNYAFVADGGSGLLIIDISDPTGPSIVRICETSGTANGIAISDNYAFVADGGSGLLIIDISDLTGPLIIGACETSGTANGITISGNYAFVADWENGLQVIDISDPTRPNIVGSCDTSGDAHGVAIVILGTEEYAFVADGDSGLQVVDISDPTRPINVGRCDTPGDARGVAVFALGTEEYVFVADWESGLQLINISDPAGPYIVGSSDTPGYSQGVAISGEYAFVVDGDSGLQVINISNPTGPYIVGISDPPGYLQGLAISQSGDYAFVADKDRGLQVIDIRVPTEFSIVGNCNIPGYAQGVAISQSGDYACVADSDSGLQVIDISDPTEPRIEGSCDTPGYAQGVAIATIGSREYVFVADRDSGLQVIDISDPTEPRIEGSCDTPGCAQGAAIATIGSKEYVFVADRDSGLQVIDISDPTEPRIEGSCDTPGYAQGVAITTIGSREYVFVADRDSGLQIIDISDPTGPRIVGSCDTPGYAQGVAISQSGDYAFVADGSNGLQIIDISDPTGPYIVGSCDTPGYAEGVAITQSGDYIFIANGENGILKFKINIGPPPEGKGNLILVAGGEINYKSNSYSSWDPKASYWQITQAFANHVFNTFQKSGYEVYDIFYFNPNPFQDTDNDHIFNQLVVDDFFPNCEGLMEIIRQFPEDSYGNHLANSGPLYIYLLGHAAEDHFLITPNEVIIAQELRDAIDKFRNGYTDSEGTYHPGTNRQVVIIVESAESGTFIDDLAGPDITVITSTDYGESYIKPDFSDPNSFPYNSFTKAFIDALPPYTLAPHLDPNLIPEDPPETLSTRINEFLKEAFIIARNQLRQWALAGQPFADQAPQMALPDAQFISFNFSEDEGFPLRHITINSHIDIPYEFSVIGNFPNPGIPPISIHQDMTFFSSDTSILDPENSQDIQMIFDPYNNALWYSITPKKNGRISLIAYPSEETDPHHLLSAKITIDVSDPNYSWGKGKMAMILAGYNKSGDYLFERTNNIANYAYTTLREMGYAENEIYYYNPFITQDIDNDGDYSDIIGYPYKSILNMETTDSPFNKIFQEGVTDLFLFLVDHGGPDEFYLNPGETLPAQDLINNIVKIAHNVDEKIFFLYDACHSGSFLDEIEYQLAINETLNNKLITITSTDSNQSAYFSEQGMLAFSYLFFNEWPLENNIIQSFNYAKNLLYQIHNGGQTPLIWNLDLASIWDQEKMYLIDESKPVIDNVETYIKEGNLYITARVFSLEGVKKVSASIEGAQNVLSLDLVADTSIPNLYGGNYTVVIPDPFPNETNYIISILAIDKSRRPKIAYYKTAIGRKIEDRTFALIIASDPDLFQQDEQERLNNQVTRARKILENKGLISGKDIKTINTLKDLKEITNFDLKQYQTVFIYLIGHVTFQDNNIARFWINPNESIAPQDIQEIPKDPDQRLLILMDTPYAEQFLISAIKPESWLEYWACIASTDKSNLFPTIDEKSFPCYSSFFFSAILSGATVAQAYHTANNAVSFVGQNPRLFLPDEVDSYQTINRYLGYYLGEFAIHADGGYSIIKHCSAEVKNLNGNACYILSVTTDPNAIINKVWAIMSTKSAIPSICPVDLDLTGSDESGHLYRYAECFAQEYTQVYFYVDSCTNGISNPINDKMVPIITSSTTIDEDPFEPNNDPNSIIFDIKHCVVPNIPKRHFFYCKDFMVNGDCNDIDWIYFDAEKGHTYEIEAEDLSKYKYFIKLTLYDSNHNLIYSTLHDSFISFKCKKTGYYLLEAKLASTYPSCGVEYIISICDPRAGEYTPHTVEIIDPCKGRNRRLKVRVKQWDGSYIYPRHRSHKYPNNVLFRFIDCTPYQYITVEVYDNAYLNKYKKREKTEVLYSDSENWITIDLTEDPNYYCDPNDEIEPYDEKRKEYANDANSGNCNPLFSGDKDLSFPDEGDYDGDKLTNFEEYIFFVSPLYPTVPIPLHKGINLLYVPHIEEKPNMTPYGLISCPIYYYNPDLKKWYYCGFDPYNKTCYYYDSGLDTWEPDVISGDFQVNYKMKSNSFNVINTSGPGILYLNITNPESPVLLLNDFSCTDHSDQDPSNPAECLDTDIFNPGYFDPNKSGLEFLKDPNSMGIEMISGKDLQGRDGLWKASYRFFGRPAEKDIRFAPYGIYIVIREKGPGL